MKKFLAAAFRITFFQVLLILGGSGLKYWISSTGVGERIELPLVVIGMGMFLLLLPAVGISGHLEKRGYTVETWVAARPKSRWRTSTAQFLKWGQVLPVVVGYAFCLYVIMPTSFALFLALFCGIILRNIIDFFLNVKSGKSERFS